MGADDTNVRLIEAWITNVRLDEARGVTDEERAFVRRADFAFAAMERVLWDMRCAVYGDSLHGCMVHASQGEEWCQRCTALALAEAVRKGEEW